MLKLSKSTTALRALIISSCIFSLIFVSGFNTDNFTNVSGHYYAAEMVCSSPSANLNCVPPGSFLQPDKAFFRGDPDEPKQINETNVRFVSSSFAKFVHIFIGATDNYRMVILKMYLVKTLLATYLLFSVLIYLRKFKDLKNLSSQLVLIFFSSSYFLRTISNIYPPGLTTVASLSLLIIFKIFIENYIISKNLKIFLCLNFLISSLIIVGSRFETTCFVLLCFFVFIVFGMNKTKFFERIKLAGTPILLFTTSLTIVWVTSEFFRALLTEVLKGNFVVLSKGMYANSEFITKFGRWAVAAEAPYTLIDNTFRISNFRLIQTFCEEHFDFAGPYIVVILQYILIASFLVPGSLIFFNALIKNLKPFLSYKKFDRSERKSQIAPLVIIFNMFLIPFIAFTPWFIWYIMPLLLVYVFLANASLNSVKVSKYLYLTIFVTNSLTYYIYNDQLGSIYISEFIFKPLLLNTLFTVAALTLWFQVPRFINSEQRK